jgi:hypothetical protein
MPDWAVYGAVALATLSSISALAYLIAQALLAWRAFKRLRRHAFKELDRVLALAEAGAEKAQQLGEGTRLQESLARLRVTLARFAILRRAVDEVSDSVGRVTAVYPRK